MGYNLVDNIEICYKYASEVPLNLVYYSHIPSAILAIAIGFFVLYNNRTLASKLLFILATIFAIWSLIDLPLWVSHNSIFYMFFWPIEFLLEILLFIISLYFAYAFIDKKDVGLKIKVVWSILIIPIIASIGTRYSLSQFSVTECNPVEGMIWEGYIFPLEIMFSFWIFALAIFRYIKSQKEERAQIIFLMIGVCLFLGSFSLAGYIVNLTGYNYEYELFGLIGMPIFLGFLAYLIVKFKAFDIKMLAAEALVVGLIILLFSEFFFIGIENTTVTILISVTILLATIFGIWLINSVRNEAKRKEELQNMSEKLAMANDQLRKLDNAKSEFISIASHQLRTPLTAIKGFVSLLLEGSYGKVEQKQQEVLNKVYTSNERMVNLVEDLLNVSRMESGRMEFKFAPWKIENICQEVMDTFYPRSKDLGLYLEYKKSETDLPELMIDGTKVREVISNLVDNALKYTPKGGVKLRVEISNSKFQIPNKSQNQNDKIQNFDGDAIRVIISDTGIGIPKEELPYLFAKFSRGKDVSRLNIGGTGLGLYVGKGIVEANGGKIWAESDGEGKGSRFIIELPVNQSAELLERWG